MITQFWFTNIQLDLCTSRSSITPYHRNITASPPLNVVFCHQTWEIRPLCFLGFLSTLSPRARKKVSSWIWWQTISCRSSQKTNRLYCAWEEISCCELWYEMKLARRYPRAFWQVWWWFCDWATPRNFVQSCDEFCVIKSTGANWRNSQMNNHKTCDHLLQDWMA